MLATVRIMLMLASILFYLLTAAGWVSLLMGGVKWLDGTKLNNVHVIVDAILAFVGTVGLRMIDAGRRFLARADLRFERDDRSRV